MSDAIVPCAPLALPVQWFATGSASAGAALDSTLAKPVPHGEHAMTDAAACVPLALPVPAPGPLQHWPRQCHPEDTR
jgi:hypothetical protein